MFEHHHHHDNPAEETNELLKKLIILTCDLVEQGQTQILQNRHIIRLLAIIAAEDKPPYLATIKLLFKEGTDMPTPGPITLTAVGQTATASVVGFDQFGNLFTGVIPTPTFTSDDSSGAVVTFDPATGLVTAVANGVANISASVDKGDGSAPLTDTESVTVAIPVEQPVLTTIKVAFN